MTANNLLFPKWVIKKGFSRDTKGYIRKGVRYTQDEVQTMFDNEMAARAEAEEKRIASQSSPLNNLP